MGGRGEDVWVAEIAKNIEKRVVGSGVIESLVGSIGMSTGRGKENDKKGGDVEGLDLERRRKISLKEKRTNHVCESANNALGMTILLEGIEAGDKRNNTCV